MCPHTVTQILPPFGILRSVGWLRTNISGLPIGPIFRGQVSEKKVWGVKGSIIQGKVGVETGVTDHGAGE